MLWALAQRQKDIDRARGEGREQGLEEGREQGLEEGREQGLEEGRQQVIREMVERGVELPPEIFKDLEEPPQR